MVRYIRSLLLRVLAFFTVLVLTAELGDILRPLLRALPSGLFVSHMHIAFPCLVAGGHTCPSLLLASSLAEWTFLGVDLIAMAVAVYITTTRRSHHVLQLLARAGLLVSLLLLAYQGMAGVHHSVPVPTVVAPASGDSVVGGPSLSASFMNAVLARVDSPAMGKGQVLYDLSMKYHIDDAYALATFQHESSYGKQGTAFVNHSLGNIVCAGYPTCNGRFRWYATWDEGFEDFYRLITREYIPLGYTTVAKIIPVYAPSFENNTVEYIQTIRRAIVLFRSGQMA